MSEVIARHLAASPAEIHALTTAHLNGRFIESLGLLGYLRDYVRADGMRLWDANGREYLDFLAGYGSVPLGHNHPAIAAAVRAALDASLPHFVLMAPEALPAALARELTALSGLEMAFFASSGSEAVDGALKLARAVTRRPRFVSAERGYHGATFGAMAVTGDERLAAFEPLGDRTRVPWGQVAPIERALRRREVAAVILEPIQAEGGVRLPPPGYLAEVAALCRRYGSLFILDEVQTGLGRTGAMFACQREGVTPDLMVLAKALSGGLVPVSAYLTTRDLWQRAYGDLARCELHCTTFRGGPLACAAALATVDVIVRDRLDARAAELEVHLGRRLRQVTAGHRLVREVRGRGLLWGIELATAEDGVAAALVAQWLVVGLLERGFVTQVGTLAPSVVRVEPPLVVEPEHIDRFADALGEVLAEHSTGRLASLLGAGRRIVANRLRGAAP